MTDDTPSTGRPTREAALLLTNLLARLDADAAAVRPQFRGIVSDAEREALREVLVGAGGTTTPVVEPTVEPGEVGRPTEPVEPPEVVEAAGRGSGGDARLRSSS